SELPRAPISSEPQIEANVDSGAPTLVVAADSNGAAQRTAVEWEGSATRPRSSRSIVLAAIGFVALLGAAAAGYGLAQRGQPEKALELAPDAASLGAAAVPEPEAPSLKSVAAPADPTPSPPAPSAAPDTNSDAADAAADAPAPPRSAASAQPG